MLDGKKVVKGIQLCEIGSDDRCYETECPYYGQGCTERLKNDILDLLKEQEAEIRQLRLALDIAKGTCKGIIVEGR